MVFFHDSGTTCFQHVFPLFLLVNPAITQSVLMDERCEVFVLKDQQKRKRKSEEQEGETAGGGGVSVRGQRRAPPPLPCYSSSSRCFLPLTGPWPFLREPFCGRRRCPRSCSVHGTPPCPSSLSRSESECMRAEEVGAVTGFRRAARRRRREGNGMTLLVLVWDADTLVQHQVAVNHKYGVFQH